MDIYSKSNTNIGTNRRYQVPDSSTDVSLQEHAPDATDRAVTTSTQTELDDRVKLCEEGGLTPTPIYDFNDKKDDDSSNKRHELQSLRRRSSISDYTKRCLPEDTFSFLIYACVRSRSFFLAAFVFSLQIAILVILAKDIIDLKSDPNNPMGFPPNVERPVRVAEVFAIVIAIITQEDVRKAVSLLRDGFDQNLPKVFNGATFEKWALSIALRASEGLLGLFVTFLLIMRSSQVRDLLLNFLAVEFVTNLDNVVFALISEGFLGRSLKKLATKVSNTCYHVSHQSVDSRAALFVTVAYFFVLFTAFFTGWGIIFRNQNEGKYLSDTIFAQFGDEAVPMLGTFTGLFHRHAEQFSDRLSFRDDQVGGALLAYCKNGTEKRWTLSLTTDAVFDPCNWTAASSESVDFDVLATANSQWFVKTTQNRVVSLAQHFLASQDCNDNLCGHGKCNNESRYECDPGYYGSRCEYPEPCKRLEIDPRDKHFVKTGDNHFATNYYWLEDAKTYNHPVYTSLRDNEDFALDDSTDILLFTGVRWILSSKSLFPALKDVNDKDGLLEYFSNFHGHFKHYQPNFVSEPVYIDSPVDVTASPLRVRWRYSSSNGDQDQRLQPDLKKYFIEASFFCAECNNTTNPCLYEAVCLLDGTCSDCPNKSSGTMCQIPPTSNGQCNQYFNNFNFDYDGGDCCENTCNSTRENICGKTGGGYIDTGYPWCKGAADQWQLSGDPVYSLSASSSGHAIALSGRGTILAVADPRISVVRLFDKDGSEWIQRGEHIQGPPESDFGVAISLSDESFNIARNPLSSPIVTLAVGAPNFKKEPLEMGLVRVFSCSTIGCMQRGDDIVGDGTFGSSVSIARDGNSVAIGSGKESSSSSNTNTDGEEVKVFTWSEDTKNWQQRGNVTTEWDLRTDDLHRYMQQGYYVSLSGEYLAVGRLESKINLVSDTTSTKLITQVYKWDETEWVQLGKTIDKDIYFDESSGDQLPLKSVVIKGGILAIGSESSVDVYSWNEASSEWTPRMIELETPEDVDGLLGWSVDLSEDASILAVGTSVENPQPNDESIRMYKWDGQRYIALLNGVPAGPAASVSLSSDGKAVAVGLPFDTWKGGSTRVYNFHPSSPCDDPSEIPLRISFTTDASSEETSWELRVGSEVKLKRGSGSLSGHKYTTFVEEMCVPDTSCAKFIVFDRGGDGLSHPGVFSIMLNGTEVARGDGNFGFYDVKSIGHCECQEGEANFTLATWLRNKPFAADWSLLKKNTVKNKMTPYARSKLVASEDSFFKVVDECIPEDCYYLTLQQNRAGGDNNCTVIYNAIYNGNSIIPKSKYGSVFCDQSGYEFGECA